MRTEISATEGSLIAGQVSSDQLSHRNRGVDHPVGEAPFVVVNYIIRTSGHPSVWPDSAKDSFGGLHPS